MRALSIRQPWAWLIIHGGKDIENRDWQTTFRGRFLVHAAKGCTRAEYEEAADTAAVCHRVQRVMSKPGAALIDAMPTMPPYEVISRGGIIGTAEVVDCVESFASPWFFGYFGFVLANPKPLTFIPCKGSLGWWMPTADVLAEVARQEAV